MAVLSPFLAVLAGPSMLLASPALLAKSAGTLSDRRTAALALPVAGGIMFGRPTPERRPGGLHRAVPVRLGRWQWRWR